MERGCIAELTIDEGKLMRRPPVLPRGLDNLAAREQDALMAKVYILRASDGHGHIFQSWGECKDALSRHPGARCQSVASREKAELMAYGDGVVLPPGMYVFTDGNGCGGVGVVFVVQGSEGETSDHRHSLSVFQVFEGGEVPGLESASAVADALREGRNVFAEMAALYFVFRQADSGSAFTVVHDYRGVAAWFDGSWKKDGGPAVAAVVDACRRMREERSLAVEFQHQPGHQSTWAGRDEFAFWNGVADKLASQAAAALC